MDHVNLSKRRSRTTKRIKKAAIKVVYISTPMKVKTSASQFRALVQELTGKDSDTVSLMDVHGGAQNYNEFIDTRVVDDLDNKSSNSSINSFNESPTCSGSLFEPFDVLLTPMDGGFMSMLESNLFGESSQLGVFN